MTTDTADLPAVDRNPFTRGLRPVLELYAGSFGLGSPDTDVTVVSDLLADLRHWCDQQGWDFGDLDRNGYNHYINEASDLIKEASDLAALHANNDN